jgi:type IV pilus assembly protein PilO
MLTAEQQTEDKLKADFEKKVQEAANIEKYRDQMVEMERSFSAMLSQLPKETEVPGLLNDITDKGVASGLSFKGIELKPEKKAEFYVELPIDVKVVGGYHDFGNFVSALAGLPRIVTLHDFVIIPTDKASGASASSKQAEGSDAARSSAELSMTITARTYRYKTEGDDDLKKTPKPAVPPAPAAAK